MKRLITTSEHLKAMVILYLAVALDEPMQPLQEIDLEAIMISLVGCTIGIRVAQARQTRKPRPAMEPAQSQIADRRR